MKPLFVLLIVFVIAFFIYRGINGVYSFPLPARISMAAMLLFTSIAHFAFTRGMEMMLPGWIPFKKFAVYLTGVIEVVAAVALLLPAYYKVAGWFLIFFFILLLPANIFASMKKVDYQKGDYSGNGLGYLWFRVPLQVFFGVWIYYSIQ